ncbi:DUF1428 domain-containing protein [Kiloniella laminariae]|uniref:DUF1428 domain-containing protein n=1 Tax=Kiloniella laminariae TaxID=454162 RepID=A0ABT4LJR7_9PROT|nr:DUF1428 domain-containing protein [Kiloniella laminariae]MCZ4281344.1 DUF1428 domain-containing protein [Kiloniella laminariae]
MSQTSGSYVDGFVAAVPTANKQKYIDFAKTAARIFKKYGALQLVECWGDDVPEGKITSFPMAVQCQEDETVIFSWIIWPDSKTRNAGMAKVMSDPEMNMDSNSMPFDGKRVIYGGFDMIVNE